MKYKELIDSLSKDNPPEQINGILKSLWHDAKGNWEKAHSIVQEIDNPDGSWVHAYLHRKEGDLSNAGYWYSRAGRKAAGGLLQDEWESIVKFMIEKEQS